MLTEALQRMWINQPSTLQPLHHLDGTNVLAQYEYGSTWRVWFLSGNVVSQQVLQSALSKGWHTMNEATEAKTTSIVGNWIEVPGIVLINLTPHDGPAPNTMFTASHIPGAFFVRMHDCRVEKLATWQPPIKEHWLVRLARWISRTGDVAPNVR